jgi:hypothetical protein
MKLVKDFPIWCQTAALEGWQTEAIALPEVHCQLAVPQHWHPSVQLIRTPFEVEQRIQGQNWGEMLSLSLMEQSDPTADICNWVDGITQIIGFPILALQKDEMFPELLEWNCEGSSPALTEHLQVDETYLYQGLARLPGSPAEMIRLYLLLARREQRSWKVSLSFLSACLPGLPEGTVIRNDHVRAGAVFGGLKLFR